MAAKQRTSYCPLLYQSCAARPEQSSFDQSACGFRPASRGRCLFFGILRHNDGFNKTP
ncbi:hypothetical protein HMPREF1249_0773 [Jonquetella sp. BV3C21]|nr:hypothetical protein GCWU000246_00336 [Jonquetella anthropi E3_33 E1]ERL24810.1 hypothetical protein HMPREF1249_0773 [Jonquetella sp. BV3C21]